MANSLLTSKPVQIALGGLLGGYMALVQHTTRWQVRHAERMETVWESGDGVVVAFWHSRLMMSIALWPKRAQPPAVLISRSAEGDVIARAAVHHKVAPLRGSSRNRKKASTGEDKGGLGAFRAMVRHLKSGGAMAITPDGPRGPRMRASAGAITLAAATGAPVIAVSWAIARRRMFNSWDRFVLPLPFSRGVICWGEPFTVPRDADLDAQEAWRLKLENQLNALTEEADLAVGLEPVAPADAPAPGRRTEAT